MKAKNTNNQDNDKLKRSLRLRAMQKNAVENLDFEKAEKIERMIKNQRKNKITKINIDMLTDKLESIIYNSEQNIEKLKSQSIMNEINSRRKINTSFEELKEKHKQELFELMKKYAVAKMHETQRAIPKKDELILQSKGAGMSGNFQEAKRLRDLAYVIGETDLESRLAKTDIDFDNNKKVLMKKQSTEIKNLAQKLNSELLSIKENTTLMIEKENELKNVRISSIYSQEFSKDPKGIRAFKEIMDRNNCQIPSGLIIPGQFIEKNIEVSQSSSKIARRKSK